MTDLDIRIGGSLDEMGQQFLAAWHRAEAGDLTPTRPVLVFENWVAFFATFSEARLTLLHRLAEGGPAASIRALALALSRDYRSVHDDVVALTHTGLIVRDGRTVAISVSRVRAYLDLLREHRAVRAR